MMIDEESDVVIERAGGVALMRRLAGVAVACITILLVPVATALAQEPTSGVHFHHVHLNVTDPKTTIAFYKRFFGANDVNYRGLSAGLFTEKSFILLTKVATPPPTNLGTTLWHIGWAGVDGESEFAWRTKEGVRVQTPITPLGLNHYMYFWGPDRELIEVYTGSKNHRFEHFHLLASDLRATVRWFQDYLGLAPSLPADAKFGGVAITLFKIDNVNLYVFERPTIGAPRPVWFPPEVSDTFPPTEGTAIDHVAFSFPDITPVFQLMRSAGVPIVHARRRSPEYGLTSFFVRGPDGLLVEIVEEPPVPEGIWRTKP
jgi:catechol 2,3-dioxygenase-like lactoylglutathione lyase family enzyme